MKFIVTLLIVLMSVNASAAKGFSYFCLDVKDLQKQLIKDIDISESNYTLHVDTQQGNEKATYIQGDDSIDVQFVNVIKTLKGSTYLFLNNSGMTGFLKERRALYGNNKVNAVAQMVNSGELIQYGCFKK